MTIEVLSQRGVSNRAIARQLGVHEHTVRYRLRRLAEPMPDGRGGKERSADRYAEAIARWMGEAREGGGVNLQVLYAWLVEEHGVAFVALTRGARGCEIVSCHERVSHAGHRLVEANGDPVGAGDAFTAILACAMLRGSSLEATADAGNRYASYVASQRGAMPPVPEEAVPWG